MLNSDLHTIEAWSKKWRLSFGHKSSYFVFHRPGTRSLDVDSLGGLHFFGRPIRRESDSVYLLGVYLDAGLTFKENTRQLLSTCRRRRNILHGFIGSEHSCIAEALLVAYKGFIRSKIEVTCAVYAALSHADQLELEKFQSSCLRLILYARDNTPAVILNNECSTLSLAYRRDDIVLRTYMKVLAFPQTHPLRVSLEHWWKDYRRSELTELGHCPRSFFGVAFETHRRFFFAPPPREPPEWCFYRRQLPPYVPFHKPANSFDIFSDFRCTVRDARRDSQYYDLLASRAAFWYTHLHPPKRRNWLKCLPTRRRDIRTIARLRTGYAGIGYFSKVRDENGCFSQIPCPGCDLPLDSPTHLLFECPNPACVAERANLFESMRADFQLEPTLPILLGFHPTVSSHRLRQITTKTARFVEAIGRSV